MKEACWSAFNPIIYLWKSFGKNWSGRASALGSGTIKISAPPSNSILLRLDNRKRFILFIAKGNAKERIEVAKLSDTMLALITASHLELGNDSVGVSFYETNSR